jgi:hypothetical protein
VPDQPLAPGQLENGEVSFILPVIDFSMIGCLGSFQDCIDAAAPTLGGEAMLSGNEVIQRTSQPDRE